MKRLFHYTRKSKLKSIFTGNTPAIIPATIGIAPGERATVWLSYETHWEPTASPGIIDAASGTQRTVTFEELCEKDTPIRIEVSGVGKLPWTEWATLSHCPASVVRSLRISAASVGSNVGMWRMTFEPIPVQEWIALEEFAESQWRSVLDQ